MNNSSCAELFGERLRKLRVKSGFSQQALSSELGISKAAMCYYENGQRVPDIDVLVRIADYFNVSADYLIGRSDVASIDPSQKMQVACKVTGLSEKAVKNLQNIQESGLRSDLLIENERLKDIINYLDELERLAINKMYWEQVVDPLVNSDEFFDNLSLNDECLGKPKCKRFNEQYSDDKFDCQTCGRDVFRETDSEFIYNLIVRTFDELLEQDLGIYGNTQGDCSSCYQDNADLVNFKLTKLCNAMITDIQENADCSAEFERKNRTVRKKMTDKLIELKEDIKRDRTDTTDAHRKSHIDEIIEKEQLEIAALQTYLDKYDEFFKLKEQKGASDNGGNNPPKE